MIDEIHIRDIALIRDGTLLPARGLTVVTGETGAGKTALLSAAKLLCGERADASFVREGSESLLAEGRFFVGGDDEEEIVATRKVGVDGRSRVTLNGSMATVGELAETVGATVDLCGQHEHQRLLKPSNHVGLLDAWAKDEVDGVREAYRQALDNAAKAAQEVARIEEARTSSAAMLDEARYIIKRVDSVNPEPGEYEELAASLSRAEHAEALAVASDTAHVALAGDGGAIDSVHQAIVALQSMAAIDQKLGETAEGLREAVYVLEDAASEALRYRDKIEYDPDQLAENQERLASMQGLMRDWGPRMEDVLERRQQARDLISMVDDSEEREAAAHAELEQAETKLADAADVLDVARRSAAPAFAEAVNAKLAALDMQDAEIECSIEKLERASWTKDGPSRVEFLFRPGVGLIARPLARIASGGEISRVMLAVKAILGDADNVETLIFDEVDAGVGGQAALAIASVLVDLAKTHQVIVVTHLPQIAVVGEVHYEVKKRVPNNTTDDSSTDNKTSRSDAHTPAGAKVNTLSGANTAPETALVAITGNDRVREIARMLSGDETKASLKHAKEMLGEAAARYK